MSSGHLVATWQDARLFAALAGTMLYFWRRSVLLTMLGGMAVYLPLHLALGW
jgi:branched-subunit amino acid transport protein